MKIFSTIARIVLICMILQAPLVSSSMAQESKPVMENVFFNVVWGSAVGAILGVAVAVIGSDDHSSPDNARTAVFTGATVGGLLGLGLGLFAVFQGATFEGSELQLADGEIQPLRSSPVVLPQPRFVFLTSPKNPRKISGFRATVFEMKF